MALSRTVLIVLCMLTLRVVDVFGQQEPFRFGWPTYAGRSYADGTYRLELRRLQELPDDHLIERSKGLAVFSDPKVVAEFDITAAQKAEIDAIYDQLQNAAYEEFGYYSSEQSKDPEHSKARSEFVGRQEKHFIEQIEKVLMPHQLARLEKLRFHHKVRFSSFIDVLCTDPVDSELSLSDKQKTDLRKIHEDLIVIKRKKQAKLLSKYRNQVLDGVSAATKKRLISALGTDFFDENPDKSFVDSYSSKIENDFGCADVRSKVENGKKKLHVIVSEIEPWRIELPALYLLCYCEIVKELEITESQKADVKKAYARWRAEGDELLPIVPQPLEGEEYKKFWDFKMRVWKESKEVLQVTLLDFQHERLNQIRNQKNVAITSLKAFLLDKENDEILRLSPKEIEFVRKTDFAKLEHGEGNIQEAIVKCELDYRDELIKQGLEKDQEEQAVKIFGKDFFGR